MSNGFPPGVPCWVDTSQPDSEAAAAFYADIFGWTLEDMMPPGSDQRYFIARLDAKQVAAVGSSPAGTSMWSTYIAVANVNESVAAARAAGGTVIVEPFDAGDSGRMAVLSDPDGAEFRLWQANRNPGVELFNAPGSWNFSDLHTRDIDGAKAFYGTVFGWETSELNGGTTMIRVQGYGDAQEAKDPGFKQRQTDMGAPEGFADCIAWMVPAGEAGPHWHVSFSVADADAVAARTAELGGEVVVEPHDVPWVRMATLRDPQGATFSVGKFMPPE